MCIAIWFDGLGPKTGAEYLIWQRGFSEQLWLAPASRVWQMPLHTICRRTKIDGAYSRGHDTPAKTTNHARHAKQSYICNKYEIVEKGHENRAKKK